MKLLAIAKLLSQRYIIWKASKYPNICTEIIWKNIITPDINITISKQVSPVAVKKNDIKIHISGCKYIKILLTNNFYT